MIERQPNRLSIEHCQKALKKNGVTLTDEQVERLREFLYLLAEIEYEHYKKETNSTNRDSD